MNTETQVSATELCSACNFARSRELWDAKDKTRGNAFPRLWLNGWTWTDNLSA